MGSVRMQQRPWLAVCAAIVASWPVISAAEQATAPDIWWDKEVPKVEEISNGKLHVGDTLDAETVDVVKDYVPDALYRDIKNGAEHKIAATTPGARLVIGDLIRATKENLHKAVLKKDGTLLMPDGKPWAGGFRSRSRRTASR